MSDRPKPGGGLDALMKPRSVAIVGASDDPTRVGGRPLRYMRTAGFRGALYPVNPKRREVQGLAAYASIAALPEPVDVAVIALPAELVPGAVEACAEKGIASAILFSAGFAEAGPAGIRLQERLQDSAERSGLRLLGPNCLGAYNAASGFFATFSGSLEDRFPKPGNVGLVSQSGAYAGHVSMLAARRHIGLRYWITTGNECDLELAECLAWLVEDPEVEVIVAYAEGLRRGDRLLTALARARALAKPVIFMKVGRSAVGAAAVQSHTAALAGADAVYDAALKQYGAYRARDSEELLDVLYACGAGLFPEDRRIGLVTVSGGVGIQMADAAADHGLEVAAMPKAAEAALKARLPYAASSNPVDVTGQVYNEPELIGAALEAMLGQAGYPAVVAFFSMVAAVPNMEAPMLAAFRAAKARYPDRLLINCVIGTPELAGRYEAAGCLVFEDPNRAVRAVAALAWFGRSFAERRPGPQETEGFPPLPAGPIDEAAAKEILGAAGLPALPERLAPTAEAAAAAAAQLGGPVALKIVSPDIAHKADLGGVLLDVTGAEAVRAGFAELMARARSARPEADLTGVLVGPMAGAGVETILGVQRDPLFGPVVLFGLGGGLVELLGDVSLRIAPFDEAEARRMVGEIRGADLLTGRRGAAPADLDALAAALSRLSRFAAAHAADLESLDINPFLVRAAGQGAVMLDALIVRRHSKSG